MQVDVNAENGLAKAWEVVRAKLNPEEWRYKCAEEGDYINAVFGFLLSENPDATQLQKGKKEREWEKKVWKALGYKVK